MDNPSLLQMLGPYGGIGFIGLLMMGWGVLVTLFWMVCAWRAMRAHEALTEAVRKLADYRE